MSGETRFVVLSNNVNYRYESEWYEEKDEAIALAEKKAIEEPKVGFTVFKAIGAAHSVDVIYREFT